MGPVQHDVPGRKARYAGKPGRKGGKGFVVLQIDNFIEQLTGQQCQSLL